MVQFLAMLMALLESRYMLLKIVLECMLQLMQLLLKVVLESMPSPSELVACIVVASGRKSKCHGGQMLLAAFGLVLALCECHVRTSEHASPPQGVQSPLGHMYACALPNVAHNDLLGIRRSNLWKKERRFQLTWHQVEQNLGASEHISLDDAITKRKSI